MNITLPYKVFNRVEAVKQILQETNSSRVLLITGKNSFSLTGAKQVLASILTGKKVYNYCDFETNPKLEDLVKGANIVKDFSPDIIIAIGGGSVLDTAKIISALPADFKLAKNIIINEKSGLKRRYKLIAIPTTAGSGSECTHFAVAYIDQEKYSIADFSLIPDYIILDATLTWTMSPYLTAVTGMDAISQAIESFWAVGSTDVSKEYSKKALKMLLKHFPKVVKNPNPQSREGMLLGSHIAGKAINIAKTTAAHAMSYILTILYNIPHGHAVSLTLPYFFEYNLNGSENYNEGVTGTILSEVRKDLFEIIGCRNENEGKIILEKIILEAGLQNSLADLGFSTKKDTLKIINGINSQRIKNNPKILSKKDLLMILEKIL